jgi:hypothetical protein
MRQCNVLKRAMWRLVAALAIIPMTRAAAASTDDVLLLSQSAPVTAAPATEPTASQSNTHQFNQLFQFQTTPNICAAGEGYVSGQVSFTNEVEGGGGFDYFGDVFKGQQTRLQVQGQYGVTDRLAAGAYIPVVYSPDLNGHIVTTGDVGIYGQYKLDQLISRDDVDVTAQVDLILPTGQRNSLGDAGRLGARATLLAYKDFGQRGPGVLGAYAFVAYSAHRHPDGRTGIAATYEFPNRLAAVAELYIVDASDFDTVTLFTPGLIYRGDRPFEFALGVPLGLTHTDPDWGVTFKLTYTFPR